MDLICKRDFITTRVKFKIGKKYDSWTFQGLNHIVKDDDDNKYPFDPDDYLYSDRPYIWDYFLTVDSYRENQLNKLLNEGDNCKNK